MLTWPSPATTTSLFFLNILYKSIKLTIKLIMISFKNLNITLLLLVSSILLISCSGIPGADARKYSKDPAKRVAKNVEEGRGFRF